MYVYESEESQKLALGLNAGFHFLGQVGANRVTIGMTFGNRIPKILG